MEGNNHLNSKIIIGISIASGVAGALLFYLTVIVVLHYVLRIDYTRMK